MKLLNKYVPCGAQEDAGGGRMLISDASMYASTVNTFRTYFQI